MYLLITCIIFVEWSCWNWSETKK